MASALLQPVYMAMAGIKRFAVQRDRRDCYATLGINGRTEGFSEDSGAVAIVLSVQPVGPSEGLPVSYNSTRRRASQAKFPA